MSEFGKGQHILSLAEELLTNIEDNRISGESIVLKATRLANLAGSKKIQDWLWYEKHGYNLTEPVSVEYLSYTGRNIFYTTLSSYQKKPDRILYGSLATLESNVEMYKLRIENLKYDSTPKTTTMNFATTSYKPPSDTQILTNLIGECQNVINKVRALIHNFASNIYYEMIFSNISEDIFENFKGEVDSLLAQSSGEVLQKIPSIYRRLAEGDTEAISHALTTCRRIIDTFADTIYPPSDTPINIGGQEVKLTAQHHQNRINAYVRERVSSDSRRTKFRQTLGNLYGRVSAGVHTDVTLAEARSLFLETYLLLGEIITL
jgi:hypothetical protein